MNGFEKSIKTLEFDKIRNIVAGLAGTEGAAERLNNLSPSTDLEVATKRQEETEAARELLYEKGSPSFGRIKNIPAIIDRVEKGAILTTGELLNVAVLLGTAAGLKKYPLTKSQTPSPLKPYFDRLELLTATQERIRSCIVAEDLIADTASSELNKIRRNIRKVEIGIKNTLDSFVTGGNAKYLQENIVTQRQGRYVVPVKADCKNEIKGIVHDTSASGLTLFIEPLAVFEANNTLRELEVQEKTEIEKILSELSQDVLINKDSIYTNYHGVTALAVIFAKAEYSISINGVKPLLDNNKGIGLIEARHPLLPKETVVPISIHFGKKDKTLIVTGPNTGGKTVTLKTIGLMAMMAQSGLHIPCQEGSHLPVFESILADIGDEQSIEQSLSTFSSHMVNIVGMLQKCDDRSLVLLDELGAGTDPVEGAALAIAILEYIKDTGAITAATTHYSELKLYALQTPGVVNASCEFDINTLKPTFRLITGLPGKSNAFAISARLGLSEDIIDIARERMAEDNRRFDSVLGELEQTKILLEKEKSQAQNYKKQAEHELEKARQEAEKMLVEANRDLEKAQAETKRLIAGTKRSSDIVFDELNKLRREREKEITEQRLKEAREEIRRNIGAMEDMISYIPEETQEDYDPSELKPGDNVVLKDINKVGILKSVTDNTALVRAGIIDVRTDISNLRPVKRVDKRKAKSKASSPALPSVKSEIDVRGQIGDDAWYIVDSYLDEAVRGGLKTVTIIHGKGTGALKSALWKQFRNDRRISSYRSGRYGEGETGVTIISLN